MILAATFRVLIITNVMVPATTEESFEVEVEVRYGEYENKSLNMYELIELYLKSVIEVFPQHNFHRAILF